MVYGLVQSNLSARLGLPESTYIPGGTWLTFVLPCVSRFDFGPAASTPEY